MNTQKLTLITAAIVAILAALGLYYFQTNKPSTDAVMVGDLNLAGQPSIGNENAAVKVAVFEDFKCPVCKRFEDTVFPKLKADYIDTGKIEFYFFNFAFIGPDSTTAAIATECVYEQDEDAFWEYQKLVFDNQGDERTQWATKSLLVDLANQVSEVDVAKLEECISSGKYDQEVRDDKNMGVSVGVQGTPTVYVDGQPVRASLDYNAIKSAIEAKLK